MVDLNVVVKSEVEVAAVVVLFVALKFVTKKLVEVPVVETKFVAKRLEEVAFVVVAFAPVKFWSVVEPVARKFADEMRLVAESAVVEAYGRTDAVVPVAINVLAVTFPAKIADDEAKT